MSLSVSLPSGLEWSSNGLSGLFARPLNALDPAFYLMLNDVFRFKADVLAFLAQHEAKAAEETADTDASDSVASMTLQAFCQQRGYWSATSWTTTCCRCARRCGRAPPLPP